MNGTFSSPLPGCCDSFIENLVASMHANRRTRAAVRNEMRDHFEDALAGIEDLQERQCVAQSLILEFGDVALLGELMRRGKKRCERGLLGFVLGAVIFMSLAVMAFILGGSRVVIINLPAIIVMSGFIAGPAIIAFGFPAMKRALRAMRGIALDLDPDTLSNESDMFGYLLSQSYRAAGAGSMVGFIYMLAHWDDPSLIGSGMVIAMSCVFYGIGLGECVFRPVLDHILTIEGIRNITDNLRYNDKCQCYRR